MSDTRLRELEIKANDSAIDLYKWRVAIIRAGRASELNYEIGDTVLIERGPLPKYGDVDIDIWATWFFIRCPVKARVTMFTHHYHGIRCRPINVINERAFGEDDIVSDCRPKPIIIEAAKPDGL